MTQVQSGQATVVTVRKQMNDHSTMTVEVESSNENRHVVEYAGDELKRTLESLPVGTSVPLHMRPVGIRANVWKAVDLRQGRSDGTSRRMADLD